MKRMLSLAIGLSLAISGANANVISHDDAVRLRETAAAVATVTTVNDLFFGKGNGITKNHYVKNANEISKYSYGILASALEEGTTHMKLTSLLDAVASVKEDMKNGLAGAKYRVAGEKENEKKINSKLIKAVAIALAKETLKEAAREGINRLAAKQVGNLNNEIVRRAVRATSYTLADSIITVAVTAIENAAYGRVSAPEKGNTLAFGKVQKTDLFGDAFYAETLKSAFQNAFNEVAGSMVAHYLIDEIPSEAIEAS